MVNHAIIIAVLLGSLVQAFVFGGFPIPWKKIGLSLLLSVLGLLIWPAGQQYNLLTHLLIASLVFDVAFAIQFRTAVLAHVNEQSLWIITLLFWFFIWKYSFFMATSPFQWLLVGVSIFATGFVFLAAFTTFALPRWVSVLLYLWYLGVDMYISLVFLIKSPSNIFVHLATANVFDYFYFGLVMTHLICSLYYVLTAFPWPRTHVSYGHVVHAWHHTISALGSRYLDKQVSLWYPTIALGVVVILLAITPYVPLMNDFAMVGTLLTIGPWITSHRIKV